VDRPATPPFTAIVLAGARSAGDPVAQARGVSLKALAQVAGMPMIERVVGVLSTSPWIKDIGLVMDEAAVCNTLSTVMRLRAQGRLTVIPPAASVSQSALAAALALGQPPFLLTTADHALLDEQILTTFCSKAASTSADVAVGLTSSDVIEQAYPGTKRTYWRFADGRFSGANLFALMNERSLKAARFWRRVEQERKRPWRIARMFGWGALFGYLTGRLSLDAAIARAGAVMGVTAVPVRLDIAEAAIDVDKLEDLALVEQILGARSGQRVAA
jgi:GTP:adenosylcobinamide-phosphate guanylyltransferase